MDTRHHAAPPYEPTPGQQSRAFLRKQLPQQDRIDPCAHRDRGGIGGPGRQSNRWLDPAIVLVRPRTIPHALGLLYALPSIVPGVANQGKRQRQIARRQFWSQDFGKSDDHAIRLGLNSSDIRRRATALLAKHDFELAPGLFRALGRWIVEDRPKVI